MSRIHPAHLIPVVAAVLAAAVAASASAAGTRSEIEVPGSGFASTGTECPRGTALVSQGFGTKGFTTDGTASTVVRIDSHRSGTGLASGAVNFGPAQGVFDAYAYCSTAGTEIKVVRDKQFVLAGTAGVAKASCPQGRVPVGGGFGAPGFASGGAGVIALTSRRQGRSWRVEGISQGGPTARGGIGLTGSLVAYAYCMKNAPKVAIRKQSAAVDRSGLKSVVATCPKGSQALSGGFDGNLVMSDEPQAGGVVVSRRARRGRAWKGRALGVSGRPGKATVYAYCVER